MLPYPTSLPLDEITLLVASIRKGDILADKPRLAKAVWELAGYASLMALGEPSAVLTPSPAAEPISPIHMAQSGPPLNDEQVLEYLELFLGHQAKGAAAAVALPWRDILKWALTLLLGVL
jgi:hypothetical protein